MPFPETIDELRKAGYVFENDSNCKACGAPIEWYRTPKGKMMPMDVEPGGDCVPHWGTCPNATDFRKK